jgi:flagellin FlaB
MHSQIQGDIYGSTDNPGIPITMLTIMLKTGVSFGSIDLNKTNFLISTDSTFEILHKDGFFRSFPRSVDDS